MQPLIESWDGEYVVTQYDRQTGAWIFVAVHSTALSTPTGGTRMMAYAEPRDALRDAMRLAGGMTRKWAVADFPKGGGKAVIDLPAPFDAAARPGLIERYGDLLERLDGAFETGPDIGTTPEDMNRIGRRTRYVFGRTTDAGGAGEAGEFTARGVFLGMQACAEHAWGARDLNGRTVLVQGAGSVGGHLMSLLLEAGARVKFSEVRPEVVARYRGMPGLTFVAPAAAYDEACDVYSPCATGGTLNAESIPRLQCRIVAGAANNQQATPEDARRLSDRNILYAPDFVINAGAAIALPALERMGWTRAQVDEQLQRLSERLGHILREAETDGATTADVAERWARTRLKR